MSERLQQKLSGICLEESASGAQQGATKERKQRHTSEFPPTCKAEAVLLLGSTASSSRALCNASAGDAQVMLKELCRCTAVIDHLFRFLLSALLLLKHVECLPPCGHPCRHLATESEVQKAQGAYPKVLLSCLCF